MFFYIYKLWEKKQHNDFLKLVETNKTNKALDIGCGDGDLTIKIKTKGEYTNISGIDCYKPSIKKCKEKWIIMKEHNLNSFPFPYKENSFDAIFSNQVIEHLFYPVEFLKEVHRILKPKGYFVLSTENLSSWDNLFSLILGYTPFSCDYGGGIYRIGNPLSPHNNDTFEEFPPHVRIFAFKGLIDLCKKIGFSIEEVESSGHILFGLGDFIDKRHSRFITLKLRKK